LCPACLDYIFFLIVIKLECHKTLFKSNFVLTGIMLPGGQNFIQRWEFQCGCFG